MISARTGGRKFGFRFRKKASSPDDIFPHIASEVVAWKATANR